MILMKHLKHFIAAALLAASVTGCQKTDVDPYEIVHSYEFGYVDDHEDFMWKEYTDATPDSERILIVNADSLVFADGCTLSYHIGTAPLNEEYRFYNADQQPVATFGAPSELGGYHAWSYEYDHDGRLKRIVTTTIEEDNPDHSEILPQDRQSIERFISHAKEIDGATVIDFKYDDHHRLTSVTIDGDEVRALPGQWLVALPQRHEAFWDSDILGGH